MKVEEGLLWTRKGARGMGGEKEIGERVEEWTNLNNVQYMHIWKYYNGSHELRQLIYVSNYKFKNMALVWWCKSAIPTLRLRQEDDDSEARLDNRVSSRPALGYIERRLSKNQNQNKTKSLPKLGKAGSVTQR
jgi:hypothetical protein